MMSFVSTILASSLLLNAAFAHMFISSPKPIQGTAPKDPLDPSGSNFPCHGVDLPTTGGQPFAAGSNQTLAFELAGGANTAVHGGGSCQLSLTYETDPTKLKDPANWHVIYSIEGGCPSNTKGNLPSDVACTSPGQTDCVNEYDFRIPKGVKNGHATFAWTWVNVVGNRELYMNCANVEITGGDGSEMDSFPSLFVANLVAVDKCPTTESVGVKYPNPGTYATTQEGEFYKLAVPTGEGCPAAGTGGGAPTPTTPSASSSSSSIGGVGGSGGSGQYSAPTVAPAPSSAPSSSPAPTSTPAAGPPAKPLSSFSNTTTTSSSLSTPAPSPPSSSRPCTSPSISCPTAGQLVCMDSTHFGICDVDLCAVPQAVAPGTTCAAGEILRKRNGGVIGRRVRRGW